MLKRVIKKMIFGLKCSLITIQNRGSIRFRKSVSIPNSVEFKVDGELEFLGDVTLSPGVYFGVPSEGKVIIGNNVYCGRNVLIASRGLVSVGDDCMIGPNVLIYDHDHKIDHGVTKKDEYIVEDVRIGKNCWIGAGTIILRGSQIEDNTVVGAGSIIKGHVPGNSIVIMKHETIIKSINR